MTKRTAGKTINTVFPAANGYPQNAVPIRSNIPASAPKDQYFALPPRPQTRPKNRHGLHYIKMFPVTKQYLVRYRTEGNSFATLIHDIIEKNSKQIVDKCQHYLCIYGSVK